MFTDMPCRNKEISKIGMVYNVKSGLLRNGNLHGLQRTMKRTADPGYKPCRTI